MKIRLPENRLGFNEHLSLLAILLFAAYIFIDNDVLWRWDKLVYDAQLSLWSRDAPDDIIIVAIDDQSLNDTGRWPWSRDVHAGIVQRIAAESPLVIGLDILFSESEDADPAADTELAAAIKDSGRVVLPVFMTRQSSSSYPIESLPLTEFTENAAALGHVHIDIDDDGIARQIYLKEGIGKPQWPHYSLAVLQVAASGETEMVDATAALSAQSDYSVDYSPLQWSRERPYLIPFAGPPGHFRHIGYSRVLAGEYPQGLFSDKIVLIGATAEGLGDALPTPLSGHGGLMPGVEIVANVIDAIRKQINIKTLDDFSLKLLTIFMVALPLLIYPYLIPTYNLYLLFAFVVMTFVLSVITYHVFQLWIPVVTILLFQFIGYPIWSWRRLVVAMRHIDTELDDLSSKQRFLGLRYDRCIEDEINFISQFVPIQSWSIEDNHGRRLAGESSTRPADECWKAFAKTWLQDGDRYRSRINYHGSDATLFLRMETGALISLNETALMDNLVSAPGISATVRRSVDIMHDKVLQVQSAGAEYERLRRIIDDGLSGMADGVLLCNSLGQVLLSNNRAAWYLKADDDAIVDGESLMNLLEDIRQQGNENWRSLLSRVMFDKEHVITYAQHRSGRDLMVQMAPLRLIGDKLDGIIINLSDISLLRASERNRNEVLSFLSHDLRSPLASMLAMIELARNKVDADEMRKTLISMENNTHKTLHLAEQFLQLSRASSNEALRFYYIDFNTIALNAIDQLWALSSKKSINVIHRFDEEECWIHGEPDLLERTIVNLLSNAIKHSEPGSEISVSIHCDTTMLSCCVEDEGSGIPADELPGLFEMFRRAQGSKTGSGRKQGVGLGLAFVDAVVKRHSGEITVDSRYGEGSRFCIRLPKPVSE